MLTSPAPVALTVFLVLGMVFVDFLGEVLAEGLHQDVRSDVDGFSQDRGPAALLHVNFHSRGT